MEALKTIEVRAAPGGNAPGGVANAETPAVMLDGVTKRFGSFTAVDNLTFSVPRGSIFGFLGPNGSGKTTTLGLLLGLVPKDGGNAQILGYDTDNALAQGLARTGAIVDRPGFYPYLSGRQNLTLFARMAGITDNAVIDETLALVDLEQRADARFGGYSTGMKQRLGMAVALIKQPDLLVLDEPTSGLDPAGQREIRALIRGLASGGRTVMLSSHLLHEVQEICTHLAIIDHGRLVVTGTLAEILSAPGSVEFNVDNADVALDVLRRLPWVEQAALLDNLIVADMPPEQSGRANRELVAAGVEVRALRPRENRLEERFLELTAEFEERRSTDDSH